MRKGWTTARAAAIGREMEPAGGKAIRGGRRPMNTTPTKTGRWLAGDPVSAW